jgi:hypothetical protein
MPKNFLRLLKLTDMTIQWKVLEALTLSDGTIRYEIQPFLEKKCIFWILLKKSSVLTFCKLKELIGSGKKSTADFTFFYLVGNTCIYLIWKFPYTFY